VGAHPTPAGWPAPTKRLTEQRWAVDAAIQQIGVDWDQGRTRYIGAAGGVEAEPDFFRVRSSVHKLADFERVFGTEAGRRERRAQEAIAAGLDVSARSHAFIASLLWGSAEWTFFLGAAEARQAHLDNARKLASYDLWMERAPHPVRRLRVPYGNTTLSAILHLPGGPVPEGGFPAVMHVGGMDSFKEHAVAMNGDRYLQRGIARLLFDGPGQGEAIFDGAWVSRTNMIDAGIAALDVLAAQGEVDASRLGITGVSFGSWWATQIAAHAPNVSATAVWAVAHDDGLHNIFEVATPTFKARFMAMAGYVDEDAFDAFARRWTLADDAAQVRSPYLAIAGEDDELSPIHNTYRVLEHIPAPRRLMVYRGERHSVGGGPAARLGPNHLDAAADWFVERFDGRPVSEDVTVVDASGQTSVEPLSTWLPQALDHSAIE
jgi:dipeptidyl aminopeptidase/acylaminoacyl peptidase